MLVGWLDHLPGAAWRTVEVLLEGRLMDGMSKFTLLGSGVKGEPEVVRSGRRRWGRGNPSRSICSRIWNSRAPLGYGCASASLASLYLTSINHLFTSTYKDPERTENPCVGGSECSWASPNGKCGLTVSESMGPLFVAY